MKRLILAVALGALSFTGHGVAHANAGSVTVTAETCVYSNGSWHIQTSAPCTGAPVSWGGETVTYAYNGYYVIQNSVSYFG